MTPLDIADTMRRAVGGAMLVAMPVAALAGLVSFFSPCVLPLLPGYLSYASGLSTADVVAGRASRRRGRMLAATALFVLGFAVVFVATGALFGALGAALLAHQRVVEVVGGVLCVGLGLVFADVLPLGQRELRPGRVGAVGIAAAPLLGAAFGVGWTPCIGPTLSVVLTLAVNEHSAGRGALLAFCYALGLGIPFVAAGLAFSAFAGTVAWVRRHQRAVQRVGGGLLVLVGLLMITGVWRLVVGALQTWTAGFGAPI